MVLISDPRIGRRMDPRVRGDDREELVAVDGGWWRLVALGRQK